MILTSVTPGTVRLAHRPFTEVMLRVTYQCIRYDMLIRPHLWQGHKPTAILEYSERICKDFVELKPFLLYYAKNIEHGYTMNMLRDNPPEYTLRSISKLKPRTKRRNH